MPLTNFKRRAESVHFEGQDFDHMDLRSMKAFSSTWKNCTFRGCQFDLSDWRASKFEGCQFVGGTARLVNWATSFFEDCFFGDIDMEQASFMGSYFRNVTFESCRMAYGDTMFQDATAKKWLVFQGCNLHGSNLDFREVEPKGMSFAHSNFWGAKISMGCAFWEALFDDRSVRQFLALVARVSDDPRIAELAGDQYRIVQRAMDGRKGCIPDLTTSPATTSTPIPNSQAQTAMTPTPILQAMMRTD